MNVGDLHVKVQFYADDTARVLKWWTAGTSEKKSLVVIETNVPKLAIHYAEGDQSVTLSSRDLMVRLSKSNGAIQFLTAAARNLLREQGVSVMPPITFQRDNAIRHLTIGDWKGAFPGMLKERTFDIVLVGQDHGTGVGITENSDKTVLYLGARQVVHF